MTNKERILAEVERLKAEAFNNSKNRRSLVTDVANSQRIAICEQLLHFINSLPVEYQSEDLEEEIKRKYESNIGLMMPIEDFRKLILHFVNWQRHWTINNSCEWLQKHMNDYLVHGRDIDLMYDDLRKAMEDEQ